MKVKLSTENQHKYQCKLFNNHYCAGFENCLVLVLQFIVSLLCKNNCFKCFWVSCTLYVALILAYTGHFATVLRRGKTWLYICLHQQTVWSAINWSLDESDEIKKYYRCLDVSGILLNLFYSKCSENSEFGFSF